MNIGTQNDDLKYMKNKYITQFTKDGGEVIKLKLVKF